MKKVFPILVMLLLAVTASAQKISYQAVIRDSQNRLVVNTGVSVTVTIDYGTGTYTETLSTTTNANGLMSLEIGSATGFEDVDWRNATISTLTVINGSEQVEDQVTVTAVPVALLANYAADISPNAPIITAVYDHISDTLGQYPTLAVLNDTAAAIRSTLEQYSTLAALNDTAAAIRNTLGQYPTLSALSDTAAAIRNSIGDATLTIKQGDFTLGTFTANASEPTTIDIPVSGSPSQQLQSDWTQDDETAMDYIKNKPTAVSAFQNDEYYVNNAECDNTTFCQLVSLVNELSQEVEELKAKLLPTDNPTEEALSLRGQQTFTATADQTEFTLTSKPDANCIFRMYINGVMVGGSHNGVLTLDANDSTGKTVVYDPSANGNKILKANDIVTIVYWY